MDKRQSQNGEENLDNFVRILAMASGLAKWAGELAKGAHGYWTKGRWTPSMISARHRAKIRKETLLAGGYSRL